MSHVTFGILFDPPDFLNGDVPVFWSEHVTKTDIPHDLLPPKALDIYVVVIRSPYFDVLLANLLEGTTN